MIRASLRLACASLLATLSALPVRSTTLIWTGAKDSNFSDAANWQETQAPIAGDALVFGPESRTDVALPGNPPSLGLIQILGNGDAQQHPFYRFSGASSVLTLGSDLTLSEASGKFGSGISLSLLSPSTWNIAGGSSLTIEGAIAGSAAFTKTGSGDLHLMGDSSGLTVVTVAQGKLRLGSANAFGTGTVTIKSGAALASESGSGTAIGAPVTLEDGAALGDPTGQIYSRLTFADTGTVTVGSGAATTVVLNSNSQSFFEGAFNAAGAHVTFTGGGAAILLGTTNAANLTASGAGLVIGSPTSLPSGSLLATGGGYVGMGAGFTVDASALMVKIDQATFAGTLGFDTDPRVDEGPNVFTGAIDLTGFTHAGFFGLGSATHANITGTITAPTAYKFGGGGGRLTVGSSLTGSLGLSVVSPAVAPLTLVLTGNNSGLAGPVTVQNSYLVFDSVNAAPAGSIALGNSGYVSATPAASTLTATALLGRITASAGTSVVGLDSSAPASTSHDTSETISLGGFNGYLGTTTFPDDGLTLTGTITGPTSGSSPGVLKLAGLNNGKLTITSSLLSTNSITSVVVGHPDPELGRNGTVVLSGNNTYNGGTTLNRGTLILGRSATDATSGPLGAAGALGKLTVNNDDRAAVTLLPGLSAVTLFNDLVLEANSYLEIGRPDQTTATLTLKGAMSGSGTLVFRGPTVAELLGESTRTGATRVETATVNVEHNLGIWSDSLFLDNGTVAFSSSITTPTIGSLSGTTGSVLSFGASNPTLTINQSSNEQYAGTWSATGLSLIKNGSASLWLTAPGTLGGNVTVNAGSLGFASNGSIGGELKVNAGGVSFANPGTFTTSHVYIGDQPDQTGWAEILTGSIWSSTGYVKVGAASSAIGSLSIENNATLQATGPVYIGHADHSQGTIEVAGSGASLTASSLVLADGPNAKGTLGIDGGGSVSISGQAEINQGGSLFVGAGSFTAGTVTMKGGTLSIAAGQTLAFTSTHPLVFTSGTLAGLGTYAMDTSLSVGASQSIAPGSGALAFNLNRGSGTLTFGSDGTYVWQLQDNGSVTLASSVQVAGTLAIAATPEAPFNLKLATVCASGEPGLSVNFIAANPTSWTVLTATAGITGFFDATKFSIDASGFLNAPDALFSLSQNGNDLVLNFTPVPEPSTWVLMLTGLSVVALRAFRRRHQS